MARYADGGKAEPLADKLRWRKQEMDDQIDSAETGPAPAKDSSSVPAPSKSTRAPATPAPQPGLIDRAKAVLGLADGGPVLSKPFSNSAGSAKHYRK